MQQQLRKPLLFQRHQLSDDVIRHRSGSERHIELSRLIRRQEQEQRLSKNPTPAQRFKDLAVNLAALLRIARNPAARLDGLKSPFILSLGSG